MIKKMLRYLVQENSTYLFSGFCMLYGVYLLMGTAAGPADRSILPDLTLLGTMKLYEVLVTLFAVLVYRRLRIENDGLILGFIAVILYMDPTLFNTRFHAAGQVTGLAVNGGCLALAVAGLAVLRKVGGLPITFAGARGVVVGAAGIYLSAAFLDSEWTPAKNNAPLTQDHIYYLLWFLPLAAALAARRWVEPEFQPRQMRHHYMNAVLTYGPFLLVARHLYVMQGVYECRAYAASLAPVVLGIAVLMDKTFTRLRSAVPLCLVGFGWVAVMLSTDATPAARLMVAGVTLTPVHLMAALNLAAALWLYRDTGRRAYLYYALFVVSPLVSGSCDVFDAAINLRPSFLVPLWIATLIAAWRSREFVDVLLAGWVTLALGLRAAPVSSTVALGAFSHGAIWWLIVVGKQYGRAWVDECTLQLGGFLMGTTFMAMHAFDRAPAVLMPYFALQVALFFAMGRRRGDLPLRNAAAGMGGLEITVRSWSVIQHIDFLTLARSFGGAGMMALAFVGLFAGVWISFHKDQLLAWLGDDEPAA